MSKVGDIVDGVLNRFELTKKGLAVTAAASLALAGAMIYAMKPERRPDGFIKTSLTDDEIDMMRFAVDRINKLENIDTNDKFNTLYDTIRDFTGGYRTGVQDYFAIPGFSKLHPVQKALIYNLDGDTVREPLVGPRMKSLISAGDVVAIAEEIVAGCNGLNVDMQHVKNIKRAALFLDNPNYVVSKQTFLSILDRQFNKEKNVRSFDGNDILIKVTDIPEGLTSYDIASVCGREHKITVKDSAGNEVVSEAIPGKNIHGATSRPQQRALQR